ncbi:MAG TPA: hypothetical protein VLW44_17990 [Streptosporangiaceae bacterium]|nr:hypothetical protein [Streptosporangiaceae bacterium]
MTSQTSHRTDLPATDGQPALLPAHGLAPAADLVSTMSRGIVLVAAISLFIGIQATWADPWTAAVVMIGYAGILSCAVLAVTLRRPASMRRLEYGVLGLALVLYAASFPRMFPAGSKRPYPGDEGTLTDLAGAALRHRADPYAKLWPHAFTDRNAGITLTMSGHIVGRFGYPPMAAILDALAKPFTPGLATAGIIGAAALGITAVVMFLLLPSPWRAVAPMICLGLGIYQPAVRAGEPAIVALPLLMLALYRWTSIGASGRLGPSGWASAACLGLAAATQQLAWFVAPFLLMAIFLVRRTDMPGRAAARLAYAYAAVAAAIFAAVNLPFMIWNFADWLRGIGSPLTQGAIPNGQGLIGISYYLIGGSGALSFYGYAALLYAAALLACFGLFFARLGPAVAILPWTILFFPTRSQSGYFFEFAGLWVVSLLTIDYAVFARVHRPRGRQRSLCQGSRARAAVVTALFLPVVACLVIAIGTPQPLRLTVTRPTADGRIGVLTVTATNVSGHDITPHFAMSANSATTAIWVIERGPATLTRGATATYLIRAPFASATSSSGVPVKLRVFSAGPDTLSSTMVTKGTDSLL